MNVLSLILIVFWGVVLIIISFFDIKKKSIPVVGVVLSIIPGIVQIVQRVILVSEAPGGSVKQIIMNAVVSVIPGCVLMLLAPLTGKVGIADGIVVISVGLITDYLFAIFSLGIGLIFLSLISLILMIKKKVGKNTTMPFIPFLTVGCLLGGVFIGI